MTTEELDYLNTHPNETAILANFIHEEGSGQDVIDFVDWALDYLLDNPNFPDENLIENLEFEYWDNYIYGGEWEDNPCANTVYSDIKTNMTAFNMLKNFEGKAPNFHLQLLVSNLGSCSSTNCLNGRTEYDVTNSLINIKLNSNMLSQASKVWVAKTMLHEMIHAHIYNKLFSEGDGDLIPDENDFPSLWDSYVNNKKNGQHEYMANYYVDIIKSALQQYCLDSGITVSDSVLNAISWGGLHNTTAWNNLPESTREQYRDIMGEQIEAGGCN